MKMIRRTPEGRFVPIMRWDIHTNRIFWEPKEIPRLVDRLHSQKRQSELSCLNNDPSKRKPR